MEQKPRFIPIPQEIEHAGSIIIGAAIEVHRHLGPGFLEGIYQQGLVHELGLLGVSFQSQMPVEIAYKGVKLHGQRLDLFVEPGVIVELKSVEGLLPIHEKQVVSYLKATKLRLGLLINFNVRVLRDGIRRIVN